MKKTQTTPLHPQSDRLNWVFNTQFAILTIGGLEPPSARGPVYSTRAPAAFVFGHELQTWCLDVRPNQILGGGLGWIVALQAGIP